MLLSLFLNNTNNDDDSQSGRVEPVKPMEFAACLIEAPQACRFCAASLEIIAKSLEGS